MTRNKFKASHTSILLIVKKSVLAFYYAFVSYTIIRRDHLWDVHFKSQVLKNNAVD